MLDKKFLEEEIIRNRIIDDFHRMFYSKHATTWESVRWMGVTAWKNPMDLWIYQEILHEISPDLIIECGTLCGGSALFLAHLCDILKRGRIITIDNQTRADRPAHDRITYLTGSSTDPEIILTVGNIARNEKSVIAILDSDHSMAHVLNEMRAYSSMVTMGAYLIVEDGNLNGHPVAENCGDGPYEAIKQFLSERSDFEIDRSRERMLFTFNPAGYLKRVSKE